MNKDLNKWRDILCSWIGGLNIVKMPVLSKWILGLMEFLSRFFFIDMDKFILKFIYKCPETGLAKTIVKKVGVIILSYYKASFIVTEIKTMVLTEGETHRSIE